MWMFDLLPYILVAWHSAFLTRSWCIPVAFYTLVQFCIIRPIGYGWVSDLHGDIFYTVAFMIFAALGRGMACATKVRGIMTRFTSPNTTPEGWEHYFMRVLFKFVLLIVIPMIAATLPFELIPRHLWFGFVITLICLCLLDFFFYLMFRPVKNPPEGFLAMWEKDVTFSTKPVGRLTMLILFLVYDVVVTVVWCVVETVTLWQQFYLAACLAGAFLIELVVVAVIYLAVADEKFPTNKEDTRFGGETETPVGERRKFN